MDNKEFYIKKDMEVMQELQISRFVRPIGLTDTKGELRMVLDWKGTDYYFTLDNIPCESPTNKRFMQSFGYNLLKALYGDK